MRGVFANPGLRRVQLAYAGSSVGAYANGVTIAVYAYEHGGATAVGVVTAIRQVIAASIAPFAASFSDKYLRERVMLFSDLARVVTVGTTAFKVVVTVGTTVEFRSAVATDGRAAFAFASGRLQLSRLRQIDTFAVKQVEKIVSKAITPCGFQIRLQQGKAWQARGILDHDFAVEQRRAQTKRGCWTARPCCKGLSTDCRPRPPFASVSTSPRTGR